MDQVGTGPHGDRGLGKDGNGEGAFRPGATARKVTISRDGRPWPHHQAALWDEECIDAAPKQYGSDQGTVAHSKES